MTMLKRALAGLALCGTLLAPSTAGAAPSHAAVGRLDVTDAARRDPFAPGARRWSIFVYPDAARHPRYTSDRALLADMAREGYYGQSPATIASWGARAMPTMTAPGRGKRPLILLMPGQGVAAIHYGLLASALVARGYAVALLDLPYLGYARGADGRLRRASDDPAAKRDDPAAWAPRLTDWERDLSASLDALRHSRYAGRIDFTHIVAAGHSLGGTIALDACRADERVRACADFEGAPFGSATETDGPVKPTLFVLSRSLKPERPLVAPDAKGPMVAFLKGKAATDAFAVNIGGGSHMSFSDAPLVMPDTISQFGGEVMSAERSMTVYPALLDAFARTYGSGRGDAAAFAAAVAGLPEARATLVNSAAPRP